MVVPYSMANYRRELCKSCPTPCQYQNDVAYRKEGDNACPISRWGVYKLYVKNKIKGLGDVVERVAGPIAAAIDTISGGRTKVKGCSACAKRREMLNKYLPFGS